MSQVLERIEFQLAYHILGMRAPRAHKDRLIQTLHGIVSEVNEKNPVHKAASEYQAEKMREFEAHYK